MINVGIIGTGLIAREHAEAIAVLPGTATLTAAADVDSQRLERFCESFGLRRRYHDAKQLIADPDVTLVAITTPPAAHEALVVEALEAGKYVLCEKPLAHSLASAARIVEAERHHPGRLSVSHQLRYEPSRRRLLWLCRNGGIGNIQGGSIERHSYIPHSDGKSGWWGSWQIAGGGVLITQLIHELDLLLLAMGRAESVRAIMDTRYTGIESEDYVEATIRFTGGATARCIGSVNSGRVEGCFTISGASGSVGLPWNFATVDATQTSRAIEQLDKALPDTCPPSSSLMSRGTRLLAKKLGAKARVGLTPHALLYRDIASSIQLGKPLPIPDAEAMPALELCFAVYESAISGKEITLPLTLQSEVYSGISREQYERRQCSRQAAQRNMIPRVRSNGDAVRIGLIGLDTTHATTFTGILHDVNDPFHIPGAKVVAAYPGGSPDMPVSISRVAGFTHELKNRYGVRIAESPQDVAETSDLVFILSSDGRTHPGLLRTVLPHGKPVFLDKPFAVSATDAQSMLALASQAGVRVFASSAFRYADGLIDALTSIEASGERVTGCTVRYWLQIQETQGRYFWYGIHGAEMLNAIMGRGAREVEAVSKAGEDCINVWHDDGRQSSIIGSTVDGAFRVSIETDKREVQVDLGSSMQSLAGRVLRAALDVLTEGQFPRLWHATAAGSVSGPRAGRAFDPDAAQTIEVVKLLEAAQHSYTSQQRVVI